MTKSKKYINTLDLEHIGVYTNLLLFASFFALFINPVLVMGLSHGQSQSQDAKRAAVEEVKSTTVPSSTHNSKEKMNQVHDNSNQKPDHATMSTTASDSVNCSLPNYANSTFCKDNDGMIKYLPKWMSSNSGMLFRTMYVLLAVTGVVIVYFLIKAIRVRRRKSKSRKYGIITKQGDHGDMEMEPLGDGADDDDDYTVFEMNRRK